MNKPLLIWDSKGCRINAETAVYFQQTFGFPIELFAEQINNLPPKTIQLLKAEAYDAYHGTDTLDKLKEFHRIHGILLVQ